MPEPAVTGVGYRMRMHSVSESEKTRIVLGGTNEDDESRPKGAGFFCFIFDSMVF